LIGSDKNGGRQARPPSSVQAGREPPQGDELIPTPFCLVFCFAKEAVSSAGTSSASNPNIAYFASLNNGRLM